MSKSSKKAVNSVPMKSYAKVIHTVAEGAISNWVALKKESGGLDNLTKDQIKSEVSQYEDAMAKIHSIVLRATKDKLKNTLKGGSTGVSASASDKQENDVEHDEDPASDDGGSQKSKATKKRTRRPRTDVTGLGLDMSPPKKMEADLELTEKTEQFVGYLNEKFGTPTRSYKSEDSAKKTYIRIVRVENDKETTHSWLAKDDHQRKREIKPKNAADGVPTSFEVVQKQDHDEVKVYNADKALVTVYKRENVKKGDVLKSGNGTSPAPVPSVRGNIMTNYDNTLLKIGEYGINLETVVAVADAEVEAEAGQSEPVEPEPEQAEQAEGDAEPEPEESSAKKRKPSNDE